MKRQFLFLFFVVFFNKLTAQVNMSDGTMTVNVPIFKFSDNQSRLSLSNGLLYSTGKGFEVDQISNAIGTKWNLTGIPAVTRTINGLPDDQMEKPGNVFDTTKYPRGYLYNNDPISLGCPKALMKYPIFENTDVWYDDDNITKADRELDVFHFVLNGSQGSFVIDKYFNAVQLGDSRVKVEIFTDNQAPSKNIRTSIKEFQITDENGIKYIFSEQETNKLYKSNNYGGSIIFSKTYEIPLDQNPFVTTSWYVSKIIDTKTNRFISFTYNTVTNRYEQRTGLHIDHLSTTCALASTNPAGCAALAISVTTPSNQSGGNLSHNNQTYNIWGSNPKGVIEIKEIRKKEIALITFPDASHIDFNYSTDRNDLPGTKMLDDITVFNANNNRVSKYSLLHSYYIKNEIRVPVNADEEKWSRLCLNAIQRKGLTDADLEKPWQFEYYQGTNASEDFVPPYFFQSKDPWGYYNGSNAGVSTTTFLSDLDIASWTKVCVYNQAHDYAGGLDMYFNCKNGYAKNGLLKKITNPYGGSTEYQYEQNFYKLQFAEGNVINSYDFKANGDISVGGVHLSKIIEKVDNNPTNDLITEYNYTDDQGNSTLWGIEPMKFQSVQGSLWEAADKTWGPKGCTYNYKYPGNVLSTTNAVNNKDIGVIAGKVYGLIKTGISMYKSIDEYGLEATIKGFIIGLIRSYVISTVITCLTDPPFKKETMTMTFNSVVNHNLLPNMYKKVNLKIYSGTNLQSGKTVYTYTSPDDFPLILPASAASFESKPRGYMWMYGLPKTIQVFDNNGKLIKQTDNDYNQRKNDVQDPKTSSCNCVSYWQESLRSDEWNTTANFNDFTTTNINDNGLHLKVDPYNIVTGHSELKRTTEKLFNKTNDVLTHTVNYFYNPGSNLLSSQTSVDSKGTVIETRNYYVEDYNLANASNTVLNQMKNDNILNVPVSSETWQTKLNSTPELLSATVTEFGVAPNGEYKPIKTYGLQSDQPVPQSTIGDFDPNRLIRTPPGQKLIIPNTEVSYDNTGNPILIKDVQGNRIASTVYGYGDKFLPVASIINAATTDVAYTSFEPRDGNGNSFLWNWTTNPSTITDNGALTGSRYSTGMVSTDIISYKNKEYKLSFWAKSNSFTISPSVLLTQKAASPSVNGWTYYEYDIAPTNSYYVISINANGGGIDEVRLYPKNATMATTTYDPVVGKTSDCDINNRISYYEYDGLGRVVKLLDENHNIIKTYEYHFKN